MELLFILSMEHSLLLVPMADSVFGTKMHAQNWKTLSSLINLSPIVASMLKEIYLLMPQAMIGQRSVRLQ